MTSPHVQIYSSDMCPYCVRAKRLLDRKGVRYEEIHIPLSDHSARERLAEITGRFTVPQVIIGGRPVGGWDDLKALEDAGELDPLLGAA
ncbi:MAG: glutaredoxin 3 [Thermoleophilia bacterium]